MSSGSFDYFTRGDKRTQIKKKKVRESDTTPDLLSLPLLPVLVKTLFLYLLSLLGSSL